MKIHKLIIGYTVLVLMPLVPVFVLYWFFKEFNLLQLEGWAKGLTASGPIAAYVFTVYLGYKIFKSLPNILYGINVDELQCLVGKWVFSSFTRQSKKKSFGTFNVSLHHGKLEFSGLLIGENNQKFGEVSPVFCDYNYDTKQIKVLYRVSVITDQSVPISNECILSGIVFSSENDGLEIKGNWIQLYGPSASGSALLTKKQ